MHLKVSYAKWRPFCPGGQIRTIFREILIQIKNNIYENAPESIICEMAAILSRGEMT